MCARCPVRAVCGAGTEGANACRELSARVVEVFSSPFLVHSQPAGRLEVLERPARRPRSPVAPALRRPASRRCPAKVDDSSRDGHVSFSLVLCSFTSLFLDLDRYHHLNSASPTLVVSPSVAAFRPPSRRRKTSHKVAQSESRPAIPRARVHIVSHRVQDLQRHDLRIPV